jgi:Ca2+-binding EF-hand superfamily protein
MPLWLTSIACTGLFLFHANKRLRRILGLLPPASAPPPPSVSALAAPTQSRPADRALQCLEWEETAARHRLKVEEAVLRLPGPRLAFPSLLAAVPFVTPPAAHALTGSVGTVPLTPDLYVDLAAAVGMVGAGQFVLTELGDPHGPPEASGPIDVATQPFPPGPDGEALAALFAEPYDIWRQSLVRYIAFCSEFGECFRPVVGDTVANATYMVAIAYVIADSLDKAARASERSRELNAAAVFLQIDTGLLGHIDRAELLGAVRSVKAPFTDEEVDEFLLRADMRKDGKLDFDEFYLALKRRDPLLTRFMEVGAQNLPPAAARSWRQVTVESIDVTDARTLVAGLDALLWQLLASIAMPGFSINRIVTFAEAVCQAAAPAVEAAYHPGVGQLLSVLPTVIGLASISVVVHPLDALADEFFNITLRRHVFPKVPLEMEGQLTMEEMAAKLATRPGPHLPPDAMRQFFRAIDTDGDGYVSLADWCRSGRRSYARRLEAPAPLPLLPASSAEETVARRGPPAPTPTAGSRPGS